MKNNSIVNNDRTNINNRKDVVPRPRTEKTVTRSKTKALPKRSKRVGIIVLSVFGVLLGIGGITTAVVLNQLSVSQKVSSSGNETIISRKGNDLFDATTNNAIVQDLSRLTQTNLDLQYVNESDYTSRILASEGSINTNRMGIMTNSQSIATNLVTTNANVASIMTNSQSIATNLVTTNANVASIMTNSQSIATNLASINSNIMNITTNTQNIATNLASINSNTMNITTNTQGIATNLASINSNTMNITTSTQGIAANLASINLNTMNIATNTQGIATNLASINLNTMNITTNAQGIATNLASINLNTMNITTSTQGIATNLASINLNTMNITTNAQGIATNLASINLNTMNIATNSNSITTLSNRLDRDFIKKAGEAGVTGLLGYANQPDVTTYTETSLPTKKYVDDKIDNMFLPLGGGTVTGVIKGVTPVVDEDLATKGYVDGFVSKAGATGISGLLEYAAQPDVDPMTPAIDYTELSLVTKKYVDDSISAIPAIDLSLLLRRDGSLSLTGGLQFSTEAVANTNLNDLSLVSKKYVDEKTGISSYGVVLEQAELTPQIAAPTNGANTRINSYPVNTNLSINPNDGIINGEGENVIATLNPNVTEVTLSFDAIVQVNRGSTTNATFGVVTTVNKRTITFRKAADGTFKTGVNFNNDFYRFIGNARDIERKQISGSTTTTTSTTFTSTNNFIEIKNNQVIVRRETLGPQTLTNTTAPFDPFLNISWQSGFSFGRGFSIQTTETNTESTSNIDLSQVLAANIKTNLPQELIDSNFEPINTDGTINLPEGYSTSINTVTTLKAPQTDNSIVEISLVGVDANGNESVIASDVDSYGTALDEAIHQSVNTQVLRTSDAAITPYVSVRVRYKTRWGTFTFENLSVTLIYKKL